MDTGFVKVILFTGLALAGNPCAWTQGFINLDFESANLAPIPAGQFGDYVPTTNAIPGWSALSWQPSLSTNEVTEILQNNETIGLRSLSILGPSWNAGGIIQGNYTLLLNAGYNRLGYEQGVSISQTGLIPVSALSLRFQAYGGNGPFEVTLGNQPLALFSLSKDPNYTLYGADIAAYAGTMETLTFSVRSLGGMPNSEFVDNIQFSPSIVPEPGCLALAALGTLLLSLRRRRN